MAGTMVRTETGNSAVSSPIFMKSKLIRRGTKFINTQLRSNKFLMMPRRCISSQSDLSAKC